MINIKSDEEIEIMKRSGKILANVIQQAKKITKPGISTNEIDEFIEKSIIKSGVKPSFKNYEGYPKSSCISVNEEIVHSIPNEKIINDGDIVSIDAGVCYKGYHSDSAITFGIGKISPDVEKLINVTKNSLDEAIKQLKPGKKIGDIQAVIQKIIEHAGLYVVKGLSGHGIGKKLQEKPSIPNFGQKGKGFIVKPGMVFCIEPMVAIGTDQIRLLANGWTIVTKDLSLSAHFEHTIAITQNRCLVLTKQ